MLRFLLIFISNLILSFPSNASLWDKLREKGLIPGRKYTISSGSGFYVNDRYIVTNEHVVQNCLNIAIRGQINPSSAYLYAKDEESDLAILSTDTKPMSTAILRENIQDLKIGEQMLVIGYPLSSAEEGHFISTEALIESFKTNNNQLQEIEFNAPIEHGNSGGPLIDYSGKVIGVVQARKSYYLEAEKLSFTPNTTTESEKPFKVNGIAIGLPILENFLKKNDINFKTENTDSMTKYNNSQKTTQNYIVNIHCVKK